MADWDEETKREDWTFRFFLNGMNIMWQLMGQEKRNITWVAAWIVVISILDLLFPLILKLVFDTFPKIIKEREISYYLIWLIIGLFASRILALYIHNFIKELNLLKSLIRLENFWPVMAQEKLLALSLEYHERENTGKKISKINKGCEKLVNIMMNLFWGFLPPLLYLIINIILILCMDWKLGLLFLIPFVPAVMINLRCYNAIGPEWEKWEKGKEISTGLFCQSLINVQTVQGFAQEEKEKNKLVAVREQMTEIDLNVSKRIQKYLFAIGLILNISFTFAISLGIYFIYLGLSTEGTIIYIIATGNLTTQRLREVVYIYMMIMKELVAVVRMKELIEQEIDIKNDPNAIIPKNYGGYFRFRNVTFSYPKKGKAIFENFYLDLPPNKMVALVGKSGEGKTTIVRLLCRAYDVSNGAITLDDKNIKELNLYWYRRLFATVQQDVDLFDASLFENITYAHPSATEEQVIEALGAAHLEIVLENGERFPEGIKTLVGERGIRLSGGERQRVGIARAYLAILKGARVLILDEATSNLDSEAERAIQGMIDRLRKNLPISIVAIAHRLSTIQKADIIFVIHEGRIAESGNHSRLIQKNGLYSRLVDLQKLGNIRD